MNAVHQHGAMSIARHRWWTEAVAATSNKKPARGGFGSGRVSYLSAQTVQRQRSASAGTAFAYRRAGARLRSRSSSGQADRMAVVCIRIHSLCCFNVRHAGRVDTLRAKQPRKWQDNGSHIGLSGKNLGLSASLRIGRGCVSGSCTRARSIKHKARRKQVRAGRVV